jgi:hypothetical protein
MPCFGTESTQTRAPATGSVADEGGGLYPPTQGGGTRAREPKGATA